MSGGNASAQIEALKQTIARHEACFVRLAKAYGITTPLILVGIAQNNSENYAEILTRFIEEQQSKKTK